MVLRFRSAIQDAVLKAGLGQMVLQLDDVPLNAGSFVRGSGAALGGSTFTRLNSRAALCRQAAKQS
jgi:hypothetical protein